MNTPQRVSVDGTGAASCDVCHSRLDFSWVVRFSDGSYSNRCTTHVGADFDRAGVRRPGSPDPAPAVAEAPSPEEGNAMSENKIPALPDASDLGPTGYCSSRNHKKCGYAPGGKTANGIATSDGQFYMCSCRCHDGQRADGSVEAKRRELSFARAGVEDAPAQPEDVVTRIEQLVAESAEVEQVPQPGSILTEQAPEFEQVVAEAAAGLAPVVNLRDSRKEVRKAAQAAAKAEQPAKAAVGGAKAGSTGKGRSTGKGSKAAGSKAPAAPKDDSDRPAPTRRPEQKPGQGEIKVRFGGPAVAHVSTHANTPPSVRTKLDSAHVYKDGSAVIVLDSKESASLKPVLAEADSRSARAVIKAIEEGGIK